MVTIFDVPVNDLIENTAEQLKEVSEIQAPSWAAFVKTGVNRQRPPVDEEWWHTRAAAVLRTVSLLGPVGVSKLRVKYGGRKRRGHKPAIFGKASGNILRKILQQLEKAELVKQKEIGVHKGRVITGKGTALLTKAAHEVSKNIAKPVKKPEVEVKQDQPKKEIVKKEVTETKPVEQKKVEKEIVKKEEQPKDVVAQPKETKEVAEKPEETKEITEKPEEKKEVAEKPEETKAEEPKENGQ